MARDRVLLPVSDTSADHYPNWTEVPASRPGAERMKGPDLVGYECVSLRCTQLPFASPKIFSIVETWVRPHCDAFLFC